MSTCSSPAVMQSFAVELHEPVTLAVDPSQSTKRSALHAHSIRQDAHNGLVKVNGSGQRAARINSRVSAEYLPRLLPL